MVASALQWSCGQSSLVQMWSVIDHTVVVSAVNFSDGLSYKASLRGFEDVKYILLAAVYKKVGTADKCTPSLTLSTYMSHSSPKICVRH